MMQGGGRVPTAEKTGEASPRDSAKAARPPSPPAGHAASRPGFSRTGCRPRVSSTAWGAPPTPTPAPPRPGLAAAEGRRLEARGRRESRARRPPQGRLGRERRPRSGRVGRREAGSGGPDSGTPVRGRPRHSPGARRQEDSARPAGAATKPARRPATAAGSRDRPRPRDFRSGSGGLSGGRGFRRGAGRARREGPAAGWNRGLGSRALLCRRRGPSPRAAPSLALRLRAPSGRADGSPAAPHCGPAIRPQPLCFRCSLEPPYLSRKVSSN